MKKIVFSKFLIAIIALPVLVAGIFLVLKNPKLEQIADLKFTPLALAQTPAELCANPDANHCFFVSEAAGSDATGTGALDNPYKTLTPLFSVAGVGGAKLDKVDAQVRTVVMRAGNYHHAGTVFLRYSNVVVKNYPNERPRIYLETNNAATMYATALAVGFAGYTASNITVDGLEIEGGGSYAMKIFENTSNVTIKNNKIHDSGYDVMKIVGCAADSHMSYENYLCNRNAVIKNNEIYNSGLKSTLGDEGIDAMGVYNALVKHNYFHDIQGAGLYFKGHSKDIVVEENYFYNTGTGGLDPNNTSDTWGGLWLGDDSMDSYIPEPPHNYEIEDSIARNNIIVKTQGDALRMMACKNCQAYNNTIYNSNRQEFPRAYLTDYSGAFSVFKNASRVSGGQLVDELRERNTELFFRNNIVVDSLQPGYGVKSPIVAINSPIYNGKNSDHLNLRDNLYYRREGDYYFRNASVSESTTSSITMAGWQTNSGLDQNSSIAASPTSLLRIMQDPSLSANDPKSYLPTSTSEALALKAGAYIDLAQSPWTEWFPETCSNGATRTCATSASCAGAQTCSSSAWGACVDNTGDGCPVTCVDDDGDGYGNPASTACRFPDVDCNNSDAAVNPGALEICGNNKDDNCRNSDAACQACTTGASVYGLVSAKGCVCEGSQRYSGYCCTGDLYNPALACGYEACRPNQACTTDKNCSGTCNAQGTECVDNSSDACPNYSLQKGVNGYAGTADAPLRSTRPTATDGQSANSWAQLGLWTEPGAIYKTAIMFNLASLSSDLKVKDCLLQLYATSEDSHKNLTDVSVRRLIKNWAEGTVSWNNASAGNAWTSAGASSDGNDRTSSSLVTKNPTSPELPLFKTPGSWITFNLSANGDNVCQKWLTGAYSNRGVLLEIANANARGLGFASSENTNTSMRPRLIINLLTESQSDATPPARVTDLTAN
ncbi:MAG: DNRLRE domain-containing protein [Patescibacteria group bacterium]|jgi:hypothetical protein